jgi:5-methylcytosine-specific restriction endonuclease McrA
MTGENNSKWITNRTAYQEKCRLRRTKEWSNWRENIFKRDNYTCQECGIIGGYLEPHHIIPIRKDESKIFEITNGITLCRLCHKRTMWKEDGFQEKYLRITKS